MKFIQLLILLLLLPLTGFTQSTWDYDSLPKRNTNDFSFTGYSKHITDYYLTDSPEEGKKVKAVYKQYGTRKKRNPYLKGEPNYEAHYDTLGRFTRNISRVVIISHQWSKIDIHDARYVYEESDSFYIVRIERKDSMVPLDTTHKGWLYFRAQRGFVPEATIYYFSKENGYLIKSVTQSNNEESEFIYDENFRLIRQDIANQKTEYPIKYLFSYTFDSLTNDTVCVTSVKEKKFIKNDRPPSEDEVRKWTIKYYFVGGKLNISCDCTGGFFTTIRLVEKRLFGIKIGYMELENRFCDEGCDEKLYPIIYKNSKTQIKYEYY